MGEPDNEPAVEATAEQTENSTVTAVTSQSLVETEAKEKSSESKEECSESAADLESKGLNFSCYYSNVEIKGASRR